MIVKAGNERGKASRVPDAESAARRLGGARRVAPTVAERDIRNTGGMGAIYIRD